ncbi:hypothetical protein M569_13122 [Genlisea aurea]|uniref:Pentacotripeptide-repeat region of PRORP domain-containing protein n=1 Tax=Genlisea aurea TaxID=192259 RepID=S8DPG4_9LAMI|nr:hypothetical protein M569_13122 [Genlisea aurea]
MAFLVCTRTIAYSSGESLVSAAVSVLQHHRSKSRWSNLRSLLSGPANLTPSHFSQVALRIRNNPRLVLAFFHFTLRYSLSSHSLSSYATIIHILARSRRKSQALGVIISAMRSHKDNTNQTPIAILQALIKSYRVCDSAPFVFDLLVKACVDSKKLDSALQIHTLLRSKNVFLKTSTCNSLIELASKNQGSVAGYNLYSEMFSSAGKPPNSGTLNVLMIGFYRQGLLQKLQQTWKEFTLNGCEPNLYSFNILMAAYCDHKKMKEALSVWEEMVKKSVIPDTVSYNTIIKGYCTIGNTKKAEETYREMVMNSSMEPTGSTFEHLINAYCRGGDSGSTRMLYVDMVRRGYRADNSTVNAIVRTLCRDEEVETWEVLRIWRREAENGCVLDQEDGGLRHPRLSAENAVDDLRLRSTLVDACASEFLLLAIDDTGFEDRILALSFVNSPLHSSATTLAIDSESDIYGK